MKPAFAHLSVLAALVMAAPAGAFAADASLGRHDYEHNCAMCHGATGNGNGWLAQHLIVPIPPLTQLTKNNSGVFPAARVYDAIDGAKELKLHGPRAMPVWGRTFLLDEVQTKFGGTPGKTRAAEEAVRARILSLVEYISQLQE
jgi:hypothetical protein